MALQPAAATPGPSHRSANMRANRRRDTRPELLVRSRLHALRLRYRVDLPISLDGQRPIRPDIAFTRQRLAVFVDGCFWHGCPDHGRRGEMGNARYWIPKLEGNAARDRRHTLALERAGWGVLRFWEHEDPDAVAARIQATLATQPPVPAAS